MQKVVRISQRICDLHLRVRELEGEKKEISDSIKDVKTEMDKLVQWYKLNKDKELIVERNGDIIRYLDSVTGEEITFEIDHKTLFSD